MPAGDYWTAREEQKLQDLVDEYGTDWGYIARRFKGRTMNAVRQKYYKLSSSSSDWYNLNHSAPAYQHSSFPSTAGGFGSTDFFGALASDLGVVQVAVPGSTHGMPTTAYATPVGATNAPSANPAPTGCFGAAKPAGCFGGAPDTGGLKGFGAAKPAPLCFGAKLTTSATALGGIGASTTAPTGFGAKPTTSADSGLGASTPTAPASTTAPTGFGAKPAASATFGAKPAASATFGAKPAASATFGTKPAASATFGTKPAASATAPGGFGASSTAPTFGAKPTSSATVSGFGASTIAHTGLGATPTGFGAKFTAAATAGGFYAAAPAPAASATAGGFVATSAPASSFTTFGARPANVAPTNPQQRSPSSSVPLASTSSPTPSAFASGFSFQSEPDIIQLATLQTGGRSPLQERLVFPPPPSIRA